MASGFVQRWKGKIKAQVLYLGSGGIVVTSTVTGSTNIITPTELATLDNIGAVPVTYSTIAGVGTTATLTASGVTLLGPTSANTTAYLADPVPGAWKVIAVLSTAVSTGIRSVATLTTGVTIQPSTIGNADRMLFTGATATQMSVVLLGISTTQYLLVSGGPYNGTTVPNSTQFMLLTTRP